MNGMFRIQTHRTLSRSLGLLGISLGLLFGLLGPAASVGGAELDTIKAAQVKAAYLRYIAEFTTWPQDVLGDANEPIVLGTVGTDPHGVSEILGRAIDTKGLLAQNRPLVLRRMPMPNSAEFEAALDDCHLLFLPEYEGVREDWERLRGLLVDRPIVTIGEASGFSRAEGMIEFVIDTETARVTMHIDLEAVRRARLRLSSKLLGLKQGVKIVRKPIARRDSCLTNRCDRGPPENPFGDLVASRMVRSSTTNTPAEKY